ncbi:MAG: DUF1430 domain-containing protein [Streptococcaceae bacterium]|jgi:putative ABC transport system permease protein|nr:DUF1430 domain-containing protein [Streptococcaceae bacterium]
MYKRLKQILIVLSMLAVSFLSIWYVFSYKNEMLGGQQQVIAVNKSKLNIMETFQKIASEKQLTFAKQIVVPINDGQGGVKNTYAQIGTGNLPRDLEVQTNQKIINNSPNNVLYILLDSSKQGSTQEIVNELNSAGNETQVWPNNWDFALLQNFLNPILAIGVIIVLSAYIALILSNQISRLKAMGIYRLGGLGKTKLAFLGIRGESLFIAGTASIFFLISLFYLEFFKLANFQVFKILVISFSFFAILFILVNLILSSLIFYILQHQAINLSIKGKLPMRTISFVIVFFQAFSILASMFSVTLLLNTNKQSALLSKGESAWSKNKDYYGLTMIGFDAPNKTDFESFFTEVLNIPSTLMVNNQYNNQNLTSSNGYFPSAYADENLLYVNANFLKTSNIKLNAQTQKKISELGLGQYMLLIPESQKESSAKISTAWASAMKNWNQGAEKSLNFQQFSSSYPDTKEIFTYSILGTLHVSNQTYSKSPLMIVYSPKTFAGTEFFSIMFEPMVQQTLVKDKDKVTALIKKYHLENNMGSFYSGYSALLSRKASLSAQQSYSIVTNILSFLGSIVLVSLLNTIYFYQNRKKLAIERLAGKGFLELHQKYLSIVSGISLLLGISAVAVLHFPLESLLVPLVYLLLVYGLFSYQAKRAKRSDILVLKGE